ncbi:MAG TPA: site-specific integrase [Gemmatimonadaceae bacterium]|nr:site-specific integrase [Gemmatimonadaceae bacterium]
MASANKQGWSYSTGEWGVNRVRAFEFGSKGIFIEFRERVSGTAKFRRVRIALGHRDREVAKAKAEDVAAAFRRQERPCGAELMLKTLFDMYEAEVSPHKGESKRRHDKRCAEMFLRYFGAELKPQALSRREWDRFIGDRRRGVVAPAKVKKRRRVGNRVIAYDLKWLLSVLNWATLAGDGSGGVLLDRNPLKGLTLPRVENPKRAVLTDEQYLALRKVALGVSPQFDLLLVLAHETGHRIGAIRQLRWSDVDLEQGTMHWCADSDKIGLEHTTLMTDEVKVALKDERSQRPAIGDAWVFPSPMDRKKSVSRHLARDWWERGAKQAKLPKGQRMGWHSLRRQWATEMKDTPLKDLCYMGGWKSATTVLTCYQLPDPETQRAAMARRKKFSIGGGQGAGA